MELIIVIVIGGILAAVMIPRLERDPTREAANQLVRHIQYAQHLAMVDDVYDASGTWFQNRWKINFDTTGYTVSSGAAVATNPATKSLINSTTDGDLTDFSITGIVLSGGCNGTMIAFDNFGRPHTSIASVGGNDMQTECTITVTGKKTATITVQPQTGYVNLDSVS